MRLTGTSRHLSRERARHLGDLVHLVRNVAGRAVLADACGDAADEVVVESVAFPQHDEQGHPPFGAGPGYVDYEGVGYLFEREDRAIDLARPHPDPPAVDG